jgi:hypothetical protein
LLNWQLIKLYGRTGALANLLQNGRVIRKKLLDAVPQAIEWQRIGNEIDAALIFAGSDFVKVHLRTLISSTSLAIFCLARKR